MGKNDEPAVPVPSVVIGRFRRLFQAEFGWLLPLPDFSSKLTFVIIIFAGYL